MENEPHISAVLVAIERFETKVDGRFDGIDDRFALVDDRLSNMGKDLSTLKASCVTRSYLDQQILDVAGLVRKEDGKLNALVDVLHCRRVIDDGDLANLRTMGPYPRV